MAASHPPAAVVEHPRLAALARSVDRRLAALDVDLVVTTTPDGTLVLGGPTPEASPLRQRPDLVASLVTYWQVHPVLSYLFAEGPIGPAGPAPRLDEGRCDEAYEVEIVLEDGDRDGLLAHLRAAGRSELDVTDLAERGTVGLRALRVPVDPLAAAAQVLLVRALVLRLLEDPGHGPLVRWGTELHDRFVLPHFVEADLVEVAGDLHDHGLAFDPRWLAPVVEHRFPVLGVVAVEGVELEVRHALDLAPPPGAGPAGRVQLSATGLVPGRHAVTANGVRVPLRPTAVRGTAVSGVRFRTGSVPTAGAPAGHPPITFEVVDLAQGRVLDGGTYHGEDGPAATVFELHGHRAEPLDVDAVGAPVDRRGQDYPRTLDLRRVLLPRPT